MNYIVREVKISILGYNKYVIKYLDHIKIV